MNIRYVANIRLPTEKAHGVQIMKMCEAFASLGHTVELVVTDRATHIPDDPFSYYGVEANFTIQRIPVPEILFLGPLGFIAQSYVFAWRSSAYLRDRQSDIVYGRDERVLSLFVRRGFRCVVWESHTGSWNAAVRHLAKNISRIVTISEGLRGFYVSRGIPREKVIVAHDGIDPEQFARPLSKEGARARLGLPLDKKIAMYIGRLDGWKGSGTFLDASHLLSKDWLAVVIGGEPGQVEDLRGRYPGVHFLGFLPYRDLSDNQQAADVLVLPNTGTDTVSATFTSPLKLFSYMASGVPIVASDLPSIREILDERSAVLVPPDDPTALARGIEEAQGAPDRAVAAQELAKGFSWRARAEKIVQLISRVSS